MKNDITAIILAGGEGSRFNNADKGLIQWQGKPLVEHIIDRLLPQTEQIIISCNRNQSYYESLGFQTCGDKLGNYQGPLAGIQAALPLIKTPLTLICPCDAPLVPDQLVARLLAVFSKGNTDICYVHDGEQQQYLLALMATKLEASLNHYLAEGNRSVKGWFKELNVSAVDFSDQQAAFINLNTESDINRLNSYFQDKKNPSPH